MRKLPALATLILALSAVQGCSTTGNTVPYDPSPRSTIAIREASGEGTAKIDFQRVDSAPGALQDLTCRLMGDIDVTAGKTPEDFILDAFQEELLEAGALSSSSSVKVSATIETMSFSSVSPASWDLALAISGSNGVSYRVSTNYVFKTSYDALSACRNVANAFTPAVQDLVMKAVTSPEFNKLFAD